MRWRFWNVLVAAALCGCAGRPTPRLLSNSEFDSTELIPYRALTPRDFMAEFAVGFSTAEEEQLGATTCSKILVRPNEVVTRTVRSTTGEPMYMATIDDPVFFAVFGSECSWWEPKHGVSEIQLLEHEQIHFAISELEARRLNGRSQEIVRRVRTYGSDSNSVSRHAVSKINSILQAAGQAAYERSILFDSQDSPIHPVHHERWLDQITAELAATRRFARGPQTSIPSAVAIESPAPELAPVAPHPSPTPAATAPPAPAPPAAKSSAPASTGTFSD